MTTVLSFWGNSCCTPCTVHPAAGSSAGLRRFTTSSFVLSVETSVWSP
jgi:hypothetical protein